MSVFLNNRHYYSQWGQNTPQNGSRPFPHMVASYYPAVLKPRMPRFMNCHFCAVSVSNKYCEWVRRPAHAPLPTVHRPYKDLFPLQMWWVTIHGLICYLFESIRTVDWVRGNLNFGWLRLCWILIEEVVWSGIVFSGGLVRFDCKPWLFLHFFLAVYIYNAFVRTQIQKTKTLLY